MSHAENALEIAIMIENVKATLYVLSVMLLKKFQVAEERVERRISRERMYVFNLQRSNILENVKVLLGNVVFVKETVMMMTTVPMV